ncbi:MAG TPA: ubiquinol-cytochrome C chaperone family protein [Geminicoccaceae bacterium]|nr:ubiquinol-cytochrome C chaperone family protein [Geminicoccus sp.]HMU53235.1 ubiquinol-cytochrome C chaperone family protein [Geminicoccaceae bacterium]
MAEGRQDEPPAGLGGMWRRWRDRASQARARQAAAHALYGELVALARDPAYYTDGGVPDTNDGRLEMVGLHAALAMRRLAREGRPGRDLAQALVELMFDDIDRNLRELGVSDLAVGKKVKGIAASFRGRTAALEAALAAGDRDALATMLARNLYLSGGTPGERQVLAVADRLLGLDAVLAGVDAGRLLEGRPALAGGLGTGR